MTPENYELHSALERQKPTDYILSLIEKCTDLNQCDKYLRTVFDTAACFATDSIIIRALIKAGIKIPGPADRIFDYETPLMEAAMRNPKPQIITALLDAGFDVNAMRYEGSALTYAAEYSRNPEVVKVLLNAGADVNAVNREGTTPLMMAVKSYPCKKVGCEKIRLLIEAGADVNAKDYYERSVLMRAAYSEVPLEVFQLLVDSGADLKATDYYGRTVLHWLTEKNFTRDKTKVANLEIVDYLIAQGAEVDALDNDGKRASCLNQVRIGWKWHLKISQLQHCVKKWIWRRLRRLLLA